jgi:hypothetical protein
VILDGTLLRIDRVGMACGYDRAFYSGKHKAHGLNVQVIADPIGRLVLRAGLEEPRTVRNHRPPVGPDLLTSVSVKQGQHQGVRSQGPSSLCIGDDGICATLA